MEERQEDREEVQESVEPEEDWDSIRNEKQLGAEGEVLSKSKQKKLLRAQKMEGLKELQRKKEKETRRANREKRKLAGEDLGKEKRERNEKPKVVSPAKVIIDLSFDELMTDREIISMGQQLSALYNSNRWSCGPFSSIIFAGPSDQSLLETSVGIRMNMTMHAQWYSWKSIIVRPLGGLEGIDKEQGDQEAICNKEQLVYLTADTDTILQCIEDDKVYVIGGLVDRNRHKRLCADKAERMGIKTARLPIDPSRLTGSMVLTVNGVVDILLAYNETHNWETAFDRCLPKRKVKQQEANVGERTMIDETAAM